MIFVAVAIRVSVVMAPRPVFFLFFGRNLAKVPAGVAMTFIGPLPVVNHFLIVPDVIVGVVRVVDAIVVMATHAGQACCCHRRSQKKRNESVNAGTHAFFPNFSCARDAGRC